MKKHVFIAAAIALILGVIAVKPTFADCTAQYGGCPSNDSIMIDKTVKKADTSDYVDNLSSSDARYKAGQNVFFQLKVKNTSSNKITNIKVVDVVPIYLDPIEGPGVYDSTARTITFYIPEMGAGEEKVYTLKMVVWNQERLDATNSIMCAFNKGTVAGGTAYDEDTAQFCVEKAATTTTQIVGVTQVPSTGAEDWLPTLLASIAALGAGIFLKKYSRKSN